MSLLELLTTLTIGSYLFTAGVYLLLSNKIEILLSNHIKHLEEELEKFKKELNNGR